MNKNIFICVLSAIVMAFSGCAPTLVTPKISDKEALEEAKKQRELAFDVYVKRQDRLFNIAFPLLAGASVFCPNDIEHTYGFMLHDADAYGKDYRDVARRYFSLNGSVKVRYVHPELPAGRAGVLAGDRVVSINGIGFEGRKKPEEVFKGVKGKADPQIGLNITVERDGNPLEFSVKPVEACDYKVVLASDDSINAFADGKNVVITTGMMRFAETDEELSIVVAHELAHNAFSHIDKKTGNVLLGTVFDILIYSTTGVDTQGLFGQIGAQAYSQEFESEADYAGLYIVARAGRSIKNAPFFWRRMAVEHPSSIKDRYTGTHPSSPKRFLLLEDAIKEIEGKISRFEPLVPEKK